MNRKIKLLGELEQFGGVWEVDTETIGDAFKLIDCQENGFRAFLLQAMEAGLDVAIVGKSFSIDEPLELIMDNVASQEDEIYVSLVPAGSGKGWGKILAGIILIIVGVITGGLGTPATAAYFETAGLIITSIGVSLALQGITQLLTKTPDADKEEKNQGIFDGPDSTLKQGQPVPILYGELLVGGAPIHVNLTAGNIQGWGYGVIPWLPDWAAQGSPTLVVNPPPAPVSAETLATIVDNIEDYNISAHLGYINLDVGSLYL